MCDEANAVMDNTHCNEDNEVCQDRWAAEQIVKQMLDKRIQARTNDKSDEEVWLAL